MTSASSKLPEGVLSALCRTYADLLRLQRTAASPFTTWSKATRREHEFVWLGGTGRHEQLMANPSKALSIAPGDLLYDSVHKMYGTARLNPYEREVLYGYPYIVGRTKDRTVRGPLLTLGVEIVAEGSHLEVRAVDEVVRFNSLPFRAEGDTDAHSEALNRVLECTPELPLSPGALARFLEVLCRELPDLEIEGVLDGKLGPAPSEPKTPGSLRIIDQAALFVAPKTNYFLRSDLEEIGPKTGGCGALGPLVSGAGDEAQVDISQADIDAARLVFPFPSNRAQRKVALLLEDETTHVVCVEGPPGTGKSLTIANLVCHLAASGKRVLVTSQKDKALEVVDEKLRELNLAQLPMTLLRRDRESKAELLGRLEAIKKDEPLTEVQSRYAALVRDLEEEADELVADAQVYAQTLGWESQIEVADRQAQLAKGLRRLGAGRRARRAVRGASRHAPETSDVVAERASARREELLNYAYGVLAVGLDRGVAGARRSERQVVREMQALLKRNQTTYKNFSVFDRMKKDVEQARKLLSILPVWILSPDDVARLFPCVPGLFDVVIVDEASQVDLPSITPMAYRADKLVVFGDAKQMQSQRFAFMNANVALQAWQQFGMAQFTPDGKLQPMQNSLLSLVGVHAEEWALLDEHFRCLPPIIEFSNHRWYRTALRVMTDVHNKAYGSPEQPVIELHRVEDGVVTGDTQENEPEARALVELLSRLVKDPDYDGASIGVLCLFEGQVGLVNELVTEAIDPEEFDEHDLVVVNPDGFQGDERDVILYSMSWDDKVMRKAALSARQQNSEQVQGMLNVAFTRARDEIHVFHSAPVDSFGMAGEAPGALGEWMAHCERVQAEGGQRVSARHGKIDSDFEADVAEALRARGVEVVHQYPACGFSIDLMCTLEGARLAVECDGELYHLDEHGQLKIEDIERQNILERAGYEVLRIPYRKWRKDPNAQVVQVLDRLRELVEENEAEDAGDLEEVEDAEAPAAPWSTRVSEAEPSERRAVTPQQAAIAAALRAGHHEEADVLRFARIQLGHGRLGARIKEGLLAAAQRLVRDGLVAIEEGEYFLTTRGRDTQFITRAAARPAPRARKSSSGYKRTTTRRRSSSYGSRRRYRRY